MISIRRLSRILLLVIAFLLLLVVGFFIVRRALGSDAYGEAFALCPGPDFYGYVCESGTAFSYLEATNDTFLYELDGLTEIDIPFPFTFYGTTYTKLRASTNGNLQFDSGNPYYFNNCLDHDLAQEMGEMIAPYWDDLDLRVSGYLETAVFGEEPNRILVVEWDDVPHFANDEDRVTFEVQLFEGSNDIVFLYEDVTTSEGNNGSSATIGLQSAGNDIALQFGCNQAVVADATQLRFPHPENPNGAVDSLQTAVSHNTAADQTHIALRPETAVWVQQLNLHGLGYAATLQQSWLTQSPALRSQWATANLSGNETDEIIMVRYGTDPNSHLTELVILAQEPDNSEYVVQQQNFLSKRTHNIPTLTIADTVDVTDDGLADAVLFDSISGAAFVATAVSGEMQLMQLENMCPGEIAVKDADGNGRVEIIRSHCPDQQTSYLEWDQTQFQAK